MNQKEQIVIELIPQRVTDHEKGACLASCAHCPFGVKKEELDSTKIRGFSGEALETLKDLEVYIERTRAEYESLVIGSATLPLSEQGELPALPFEAIPDNIALCTGELPEQAQIPALVQTFATRVRILLANYPHPEVKNLQIAARATLEDSDLVVTRLGEIVDFSSQWLRAVLSENSHFSLDVNDVSSEKFQHLAGTEGRTKLLFIWSRLLRVILGAKRDEVLYERLTSHIDPSKVTVENVGRLPEDLQRSFTLQGRFLRRRKRVVSPVGIGDPYINFALTPKDVWALHSTDNVHDSSLRIPYDEFHELMRKNADGGLVQATKARILEKRLSN